MHICVLGAGVIGLTTAHRLLRDGHQVTLVDADAEAGSGASRGNGAQLSYSYVAPLADASIWKKWPQYLFSDDSPLSLRLSADSAQWRWLLQFLAACNPSRARATTVELLRLAFLSRDELTQLRASEPLSFAHRVAGKLVMYDDAAGLEAARRQVAFQAEYGCAQQVLDMAGCVEIEPALAASAHRFVGGVYTPDEEVGDCALFCRALFAEMQSNRNFRFMCARIEGGRVNRGRLVAVKSDIGELPADAYVLALGAGSAAFARRLGFYLPVYPLKGYSITVPLGDAAPDAVPSVSITDMARKIVYARLDDRLRVAGRVELVGMDARVQPRAIEELKQGLAELFPACPRLPDAQISPWAGFRPATPTGLPIIGASPIANLYLNCGQGSLGWTLACGSAALLAAEIERRKPAIDSTPYGYARKGSALPA